MGLARGHHPRAHRNSRHRMDRLERRPSRTRTTRGIRMKGAIIPVMIILWLIVLIIILMSKFGPVNIKKGFQDLFGTLKITEEEEYAQETGLVAEIPTDLIEIDLSENEKEAKNQLVDAAYYCWQRLKTTSKNKHTCAIVRRAAGTNNKEDIVRSLRIRDSDAGDALSSSWNIPHAITPYIGEFYICSQDGWISDVVSFTYDLGACGQSGGSYGERAITLNNDAGKAIQELAGSLARCWTIAKSRDTSLACDTITPTQLTRTITKAAVLDASRQYFDQNIINIIDDWWEPEDDAEFPERITRSTQPFYSCSSDFEWHATSRSDLCFTFNKQNDCCT